MQLDPALRIVVARRQEFFSNRRANVELFAQFSPQARVERFTGIAFAAREFPVTLEVDTTLAPRHQESSVALDHRRRDDDGCHLGVGVNGNDRQPFDMGQTRHLGFLAEQTMAPKSISAWLKSNTSRGRTDADTDHRCFRIAWLFRSPAPMKTRNST